MSGLAVDPHAGVHTHTHTPIPTYPRVPKCVHEYTFTPACTLTRELHMHGLLLHGHEHARTQMYADTDSCAHTKYAQACMYRGVHTCKPRPLSKHAMCAAGVAATLQLAGKP
jgi:hypothetical protein